MVPTFAVGPYDGALRSMVIAHKEDRVFGLARPLGALLASVIESAVGLESALVLVPVPSRPGAVRARGHDPVARMVRAAARDLTSRGAEAVRCPLLGHRRAVADQAGLDAGARAANLAGSLGVASRVHRRLASRLAGRPVRVVVCDDVVTTGATVREAQRALDEAGLDVAAVVAVAATVRRRAGPSARVGDPIT